MSELENSFNIWWSERCRIIESLESDFPDMRESCESAFKAGAAWNQRQPHPDSALLEFTFKHKIAYVKHPKDNWSLILDGESIYGGETPREAIQQAMEQEK